MSELRERVEKLVALFGGPQLGIERAIFIERIEAFAKQEQIKGMEAARAEFERRKRHIRKSMLDIMFLKWIDAEIKKLKEGGDGMDNRQAE